MRIERGLNKGFWYIKEVSQSGTVAGVAAEVRLLVPVELLLLVLNIMLS